MTDPVRAQRAKVARLAALARKGGWGLFGVAVLAFGVGLLTGLAPWVVIVVVACLFVGSALLLPAIVVGYGVSAAEREDPDRR